MRKKTLLAFAVAAGLAGAAFSQNAAADPVGGLIIGGAIGAAVGGPPGAAVGAFLGTLIGSQPYYPPHAYGPRYYGPRNYGSGYGYAPPARYYKPAPSYYAPPRVAYARPSYGYATPRYYQDRRYDGRQYQREEYYGYR